MKISISASSNPGEIIAFRKNEVNFLVKFSVDEEKPYWIEALVSVPHPLSLAPDRPLNEGKMNVGILSGNSKEKRFKVFSNNDVYPDLFVIRITALAYDSEGAVAAREEAKYELACSEKNGKVL
ncbi:MAG: hypothetical protein ACP5HW_00680 [Candidatus Micrarchaeia archaeon]